MGDDVDIHLLPLLDEEVVGKEEPLTGACYGGVDPLVAGGSGLVDDVARHIYIDVGPLTAL